MASQSDLSALRRVVDPRLLSVPSIFCLGETLGCRACEFLAVPGSYFQRERRAVDGEDVIGVRFVAAAVRDGGAGLDDQDRAFDLDVVGPYVAGVGLVTVAGEDEVA